MSETNNGTGAPEAKRISVDVWAVVLALALVTLARLGWIPGIAW